MAKFMDLMKEYLGLRERKTTFISGNNYVVKYHPKDEIRMIELEQQINSLIHKSEEPPKEYIAY